jgi:hypothetical protein
MDNLKRLIIEEYLQRGSPISIEDFKSQCAENNIKETNQLFDQPTLDDACGLKLEQVNELIQFYGKGFLFSGDIEKTVSQYFHTKNKLNAIEARKKSDK